MVGPGRDLPFEIGTIVAGRYRILRVIGRGGMGAIYEAEHTELRQPVALKVLLPHLAADEQMVARFLREARAAAGIGHPGIVRVFDLGSGDGVSFIAMEKLVGEELAQRVARLGPQPPGFVARVGRDLADALAAAHDQGIVHRDLKPQNVFLARDARGVDVVKILDFGIAKLTEGDHADLPLTRTGAVFGTPMYMPPEQLRGVKDLDGRADVYSVGAILYEALTGRPPFAAESYPMLVLRITSEPPPAIEGQRQDVPAALADVIAKALAKDREQRFPTARSLAVALADIAATLPEPPPPPLPAPPAAPEVSELASAPTALSGPEGAVAATAPERPRNKSPEPAAQPAIPPTQAPESAPPSSAPMAAEPVAPSPGATPLAWSSIAPSAPASTRRLRGGAAVAIFVLAAAGVAVWRFGLPVASDGSPGQVGAQVGQLGAQVVRLRSAPSGADVALAGTFLCRTPCERALPREDVADLSARLDGYAPARTVLSAPFPAQYTFVLTPASTAPAVTPSPSATPASAPGAGPDAGAPSRPGARRPPASPPGTDLPPLRQR